MKYSIKWPVNTEINHFVNHHKLQNSTILLLFAPFFIRLNHLRLIVWLYVFDGSVCLGGVRFWCHAELLCNCLLQIVNSYFGLLMQGMHEMHCAHCILLKVNRVTIISFDSFDSFLPRFNHSDVICWMLNVQSIWLYSIICEFFIKIFWFICRRLEFNQRPILSYSQNLLASAITGTEYQRNKLAHFDLTHPSLFSNQGKISMKCSVPQAQVFVCLQNHEIQLMASFKHTLRLLNKFHKCYLLKFSET